MVNSKIRILMNTDNFSKLLVCKDINSQRCKIMSLHCKLNIVFNKLFMTNHFLALFLTKILKKSESRKVK